METLVIDVGTTMFGIFFVKKAVYVPYVLDDRRAALYLLQNADEVVTYNGMKYDLTELGMLAGLTDELPLKGFHPDMARICWGNVALLPRKPRQHVSQEFREQPDLP
jgi:hypothetical protein